MLTQPLEVLKERYDAAVKASDILFYGYLYQERKCFAFDYNDLIKVVMHIFNENPEIKLKWQQRLEYVMIDEFQDIDDLQYDLMEALTGFHKNLFIVGDPDQTIYTWRGAKVGYLLDFDKKYPSAKTIMMNENYRSTPQILGAVNSLIDKNTKRIKKDLEATLPSGESVLCHMAKNTAKEADWITGEILTLKGQGIPYKDMTILYRAHYVTRTI